VESGPLASFCAEVSAVIRRFTPPEAQIDSVIDLRAVLRQPVEALEHPQMPALLRPAVGRLELTDYEKVFCTDPRDDIYDKRGIDTKRGAVLLVRPDGYVAHILPLIATSQLEEFLTPVLIPQQ
jgi:phenol 2-monooxygenase